MLHGLDPAGAFLYSPQGGLPDLRQAWRQRILSQGPDATLSNPLVTLALTHGLSLCADLFADPETDIVLPEPSWGNYRAIFGLRRGARTLYWRFFREDGGIDLESLAGALSRVRTKGIVLLNLPGNPTGFSPSLPEAEALIQLLCQHKSTPLVVICDDAYHGMVHEEGVLRASPFFELLRHSNPENMLVVKVDGATKEFAFFGGRVGFLTFGTSQEASDALEDKAIAIIRATVSSLPGPSQLVLLGALDSPTIETELQAVRTELSARYRVLREACAELEGGRLYPFPFNAGCFALFGVRDADADSLRRELIQDYSVGVVAIPSVNALRIAYCSMSREDIPVLMGRLAEAAA